MSDAEEKQNRLCWFAVSLANKGRDLTVELCGVLDKIYESRAFEVSQYGSEDNFIEELGISAGQVSKLRKIGRVLLREHGIPKEALLAARSVDSLYVAAGAPSKAEAASLVEQAAHLTHRDLKLVASRADECEHSWEPLTLRCCGRCGLKEKVQ